MQSLKAAQNAADEPPDEDEAPPQEGRPLSIGFTDLRESLNELEDQDLDTLVTDLRSESTADDGNDNAAGEDTTSAASQESKPVADLPPAPTAVETPQQTLQHTSEPQTKADKIQFAMDKMTDGKIIVKVLMSDGSSKALRVDEGQTVGDVLEVLLEKTHCNGSVDWSLIETHHQLQTERAFEDHEHLVEQLSTWTQHSENRVHFLLRPHRYLMFKEPQVFYMWKKKKECLQEVNELAKKLLIKESFEGPVLIVPDLESTLHLKEDGKKVWRPRFFTLRASGIYYVPKGKTKSSSDLTCLVRFENINIYTTKNYRQKFRAPTDFCFVVKHPRIQKESQYTKFLCCDDAHTLLLWVNSIRIAKYGNTLHKNYQDAVKRLSNLEPMHQEAQNSSSTDGSGQVENKPVELTADSVAPPPPDKETEV